MAAPPGWQSLIAMPQLAPVAHRTDYKSCCIFLMASSTSQVKDPYYRFSRDPDMSLDTAPYPAGVPKPGLLAVRKDMLSPVLTQV